MIVTLHPQGLQTLAQVRAFVYGNKAISFTLTDRHAAYGWMADTLRQFHYVWGLQKKSTPVLRSPLKTPLHFNKLGRTVRSKTAHAWQV